MTVIFYGNYFFLQTLLFKSRKKKSVLNFQIRIKMTQQKNDQSLIQSFSSPLNEMFLSASRFYSQEIMATCRCMHTSYWVADVDFISIISWGFMIIFWKKNAHFGIFLQFLPLGIIFDRFIVLSTFCSSLLYSFHNTES